MRTKFNFESQICTTREQSERLLALGIKKETADMKHIPYSSDVVPKQYNDNFGFNDSEYVPAWSLGRLIEMMPGDVIPEGGYDNSFTLIKTYPKGYNIEYDGFSYYHKENIYDTLIEGIEHLIKAGYFNKKYLTRKRTTRQD